MCGVAGELRYDDRRVEKATLERMRDTMVHRGPDGEGAWISDDGRIGLAHRRLSIIDLSTSASQPMKSADGSIHIVFNGEIYNHVELRSELVKLGRTDWKTDHSDTEVILQAYRQWGEDSLSKLRGMFAIALWDSREKKLLLARDRLGIKPLYYREGPQGIVFASEIKAILEHPSAHRDVDEEALFHYLSFLTTPAPMTLFKGIHKLAPGTCISIGPDRKAKHRRYWELWENVEDLASWSEENIAERLLAELRESVKLHKAADVPVGVFLSGGIDSSVNTSLFAEGGGPVHTFSIGYAGELASHTNEFEYARKMAARVGASHHEMELTQDHLLSFLPEMIRLQDEPIADPVCVPVYYVSKLARDHGMKVCQVGEGADEIFWGYPSWKIHTDIAKYGSIPMPGFAKQLALMGLRMAGKGETFAYEEIRRVLEGEIGFWSGAEAFVERHKRGILSARLRDKFRNASSASVVDPIHRRFLEKAPEKSYLNWMSYMDLNLRLPELLLMRVDKMGMGVSLESRVPFLDHKFVEFSMSIPTRLKTKDGNLKSILKKAVRGVIPDELIDRKKQGFSVPLHDYFRQELGARMKDEVRNFCKETDYLDWPACERLFDTGQSLQTWFLFNLALWWRHSFR